MVTLSAVVDPGTSVPRVLIYGAPAGTVVTGTDLDTGQSWQATQRAPGAAIVDPLAPLNTPIRYSAETGEQTGTVERAAGVYGAITSLDGSLSIPVIMPHGWTDTDTPELATQQIGGQVWTLAAPHLKRGVKQVQLRVDGPYLQDMRALIALRQPVTLLHAPCPLPACMVPAALTGSVTNSAGEATGRMDLAEMIYTLDFLPHDHRQTVPAWTWWHTLQDGDTWHGVDIIGEHFL